MDRVDRVRCEACRTLVPADGDLVLKVMVTTGNDRPLVGEMSMTTARPACFCTGCVVPSVTLTVARLIGTQQARSPVRGLRPAAR